MLEKQIKLAARLYQCRDAMKRLFRDEYPKMVAEYRLYVEAAMKKHGLDELKAAMKIIEDYGNEPGGDVFSIKILAATVEMIEPSK